MIDIIPNDISANTFIFQLWQIALTTSIQLIVNAHRNRKTFQIFVEVMKPFPDFYKNLKKCFFATTYVLPG